MRLGLALEAARGETFGDCGLGTGCPRAEWGSGRSANLLRLERIRALHHPAGFVNVPVASVMETGNWDEAISA